MEARKLIVEKFPSISQKRREATVKQNTTKSVKDSNAETKNQNKNRTNKNEESVISQQSLTDRPRRLLELAQDNSLIRTGETRSAGSILEDVLSKLSEQIRHNSFKQEIENPHELADEL